MPSMFYGRRFTHHDTPEIVNTDQGSQFTAEAFVQAIMRYMDWHNRLRPHSKIEKKHPTRRTLRCCRRSKGQLNYGQSFHLKIKKMALFQNGWVMG